jgi:Tol biopolymer transport system component
VSGNLGYSQLAWSPDGKILAFTWSDPDQPPDIAMFPEAKEWLGNIWTYFVTSGEIAQQTFIEGAARWPAWSPDGKELAFVTHDGQIGAIELNSKEGPWQLQASIEGWLTYASVAYVP